MADYLKCLSDINIPNTKGENLAPTSVWIKGNYYKILRENDKLIIPTNELIIKISERNEVIKIEEIFENIIPIEKPDNTRVPLGFIRLTEDETRHEKHISNTVQHSTNEYNE